MRTIRSEEVKSYIGYIQCPNCEQMSHTAHWDNTEIECDDCGSHVAIQCPYCGKAFDGTYNTDFKYNTFARLYNEANKSSEDN